MTAINIALFAIAAFVISAIPVSTCIADDILITGIVRDQATGKPMLQAMVTLQTTATRTITDDNGAYALIIPDIPGSVIVAAMKGFYNASTVFEDIPVGLDINLTAVPQDDDPTYTLTAPDSCAWCHPNQYDNWTGSAMSFAGVNTWVHDIYSGTGTPGGMGGFVYIRDSVFAKSNPNSECAACHQPEIWINQPFARMEGPTDEGYPSFGASHGISCDVCHKIADVNVVNINYPGVHSEQVTITRPAGPSYPQVQYGVLGDTDYRFDPMMRSSYQPQLVAEVCGTCHQDKNDLHENGTYDGIISEPTYIEWLQSPYGDINSPSYATCIDCHMLPYGATTVCDILYEPLYRDPDTIRSHMIVGTSPEYLENAVELEVETLIQDEQLTILVDIINSYTGHHVPTGVTIRNMILVVEAWRASDDEPLGYIGDQVIHDLGGLGDPAQGYYAGQPGKYYSKVNHDANNNSPTFFTDATGIVFDNRIPAMGNDLSQYIFEVPTGTGAVNVRARLIYRRSFKFLTDAKQWTLDGHGHPLADVQPPHYGHLMNIAEILVTNCPWDLDLSGSVGVTDLLALFAQWGVAGSADFDESGTVDVNDLLILLANWGPCS